MNHQAIEKACEHFLNSARRHVEAGHVFMVHDEWMAVHGLSMTLAFYSGDAPRSRKLVAKTLEKLARLAKGEAA